MERIDHICNIQSGKLQIPFREVLDKKIKQFSDCSVILSIDKIFTKRSSKQNAYYFSVVVGGLRNCLKEANGERISIAEAHEYFKYKFNPKDCFDEKSGECFSIPGSTKKLTTKCFSEYIEKCRMFLLEKFDYYCPDPNYSDDET